MREGAPAQLLGWKEPEYYSRNSFFQLHFLILFFSPAGLWMSLQVQQCLPAENTRNITGSVRRETKKEHPLRGHATSCGQQTDRGPGSSPSWAKYGWTDKDDKEMRWSFSPCPVEGYRERDGRLAGRQTTGQPLGCLWVPLVQERREDRRTDISV